MNSQALIAPTVAEAERIEAGGEIVPSEVAALLRHNADLVADYREALVQCREERDHFRDLADKQTAALVRLSEHLETLAKFAMGDIPDPMPEGE